MKNSPVKKSAIRLVVYGIFIAYLLGDIFVFHGPIARRVEKANPFSSASIADAKSRGVVARVFNYQITRDQLDRAVAERLWLNGQNIESLSPNLKKLVRYAALNDLIDHELLRVKAKVNAPDLPATSEEIDQRMELFRKRFATEKEMLNAMKAQGMGDIKDLRDRIAARIQQEKYVAKKIKTMVTVDEATAKAWFVENHRHLDIPERVRARHIFIPSLETDESVALPILQTSLDALKAEETDFATLAKKLSQDLSTKDQAGDLGWISRDRLPKEFTQPLFDLPLNQPKIITTKIGWHLVEVMERRAASPQSFDQVKEEVMAALRAAQTQEAVKQYRAALRQFEAEKIQIFDDMLNY